VQVVVDTSVLVALLNPRDVWREQAMTLHDTLVASEHELLYFDCVVTEAISTVARRLIEKRRSSEIEALLTQISVRTPAGGITWILPDTPRLYPQALELIRSTSGNLNFNDALIALACRERNIVAIASFDADFDGVAWLRRWSAPEHVAA
jgi:predicted nucleic acid-binding protein